MLKSPNSALPLYAVVVAQFFSAFADNALLIVAIVLLKQLGGLDTIPLLQVFFVIPFIILAPFVGVIADAYAKGRVMLIANCTKLVGAGLMLLGAPPLLCYGLAGVGAAAYSPAKYGILSQLVEPEKLVRANGLLEGSTILAILLGVVAGGYLADIKIDYAFMAVLGAYALAAGVNLLIPKLVATRPRDSFNIAPLIKEFIGVARTVWRSADMRFSLIGTGLFWGTGSTLRLLLFAWVPVALLITDNQMPSNLMGAVSLGIVLGAGLAGAMVTLSRVNLALIGGVLLGPLVIALAYQTTLVPVVVLLALIGAAGGFFVVPLNALLQDRGHHSVGAGNVLAVQNLVENIGMLTFVGFYALVAKELGIVSIAVGVGLIALVGIGSLAWSRLAIKTRT